MRCPPEQQYALESALKKHSKDYKLIMVPKEGHGFINPENRFNFYIEMLEHFHKHL
jgi:dipeptidyl aminopeptidase/acylaminoacyl peptidase